MGVFETPTSAKGRMLGAAVHPFLFGKMLAHNREGLFEDGQKPLGCRRLVSIQAEFRDPLSLLSDALLRFADMPAREFQKCFCETHEAYRNDARWRLQGKNTRCACGKRTASAGRGAPRPKRIG